MIRVAGCQRVVSLTQTRQHGKGAHSRCRIWENSPEMEVKEGLVLRWRFCLWLQKKDKLSWVDQKVCILFVVGLSSPPALSNWSYWSGGLSASADPLTDGEGMLVKLFGNLETWTWVGEVRGDSFRVIRTEPGKRPRGKDVDNIARKLFVLLRRVRKNFCRQSFRAFIK